MASSRQFNVCNISMFVMSDTMFVNEKKHNLKKRKEN